MADGTAFQNIIFKINGKIQPALESDKTSNNERRLVPAEMLHFIASAYKFGRPFALHPFRWNKTMGETELLGKTGLCAWRANMVVLFAYTIFVYVRCVQTNLDESRSNLEKMYMKFMAVYMSLGIVPNLAVILNKDIVPAFNNSLLKFAAQFEAAYFKKPSGVLPIQKITTRLLGSLYYSCICVTILMTTNGIFRPKSPEQIASLFDTNSKALNIVSALFYGYIECIYRAATFANAMSIFPASATILLVINELRFKTCGVTEVALRSARAKVQMYQALRVEMVIFNQLINSILVPGLKCIGVFAIVGCSYAGVRMDGIPAYAFGYLGVVILSFLAVLLSYFGEFHHRSSKFLLELKMRGHRVAGKAWMSKYARALPPLKAVMRSHYFIDRPMVLNFGNIILLQSCNFLLANP